jgi:hypothetical protein
LDPDPGSWCYKTDEIPDEGKIVFNGIEKKWFRYLVIDPQRMD